MLIARRFVPRASRLRFDRHHEEISATEPKDVAVTVTPAPTVFCAEWNTPRRPRESG
jgi:hypothetical protein